jgi:hypothetical protein
MKDYLAKIIFLFHSVVVVFWIGLFFIPTSFWPNKITFHFYLTLVIVANQFLWGLLIMPWTKKYRMVCFLTTIHQLLRGKSISDEENYKHSFTKEFLGKAGITVSHRFATILTFTISTIVTVQYFFFR